MLKIVGVIALCLFSSTVFAKGPYGSIKVAGWSGGAFTNDKTGAFSGCIASASYKSGIYFGVMVGPNFEWVLAFSSPSWRLNPGETFPIVLTFDNRRTINVSGRANTRNMVFVSMPDNSSLIRAFRGARLMSALAQGSLFQFQLTGTSILLPSLVTCVKTIQAGGLAAARDFTSRPIPIVAEPKAPSEPPKADFKAEATVIAANLLSQAGISGFHIATAAEVPEVKADVAWIADDIFGTIKIVPTLQSKDLDEVRSIIIGADAKTCKGTYFSGSVADDEAEGKEKITRVFTTCQIKTAPTTAYYLAVPRKAGGMYILKTMTTGGSEKPAKEADASIRKAVFSAIPR